MFTKATVVVAILAAVAQASMQAVPVVDQGAKGPVVGQDQHVPGNSSYVLPSLSMTGGAASSQPAASSTPSVLASTKPSTPAVVTPPVGTAGPSAGISNSASAGFPSYTNSSVPSITMGPSVTTEIVTETVTSCPVLETVGSGATKSVNTRYTTSTRTLTKTVTICTKCVEQPAKTGSPDSSGAENSPAGNQPGGKLGVEKVTKTITSTVAGGSVVVKTVTSTRTKTETNVHTVSATAEANGSPAQGAKGGDAKGGNVVTATQKIYKTSTRYVTDGAQSTCPPQKTVTVTVPDVTVTVTAPAGSPAETGKAGKEGKGEKGSKGAKGSKSAESASPQITSGAPAPFGNGTVPMTSTKCKSTGFITKPYPSASDLFPVASAHAEH